MSEHDPHAIPEAADADLEEQRQAVYPADDAATDVEETAAPDLPLEVPEGDALEQRLAVGDHGDDDLR